MNSKNLLIEDKDSEMSVFINGNNQIAITMCKSGIGYCEVVELDLDDTLALIKELKLLSKSIS